MDSNGALAVLVGAAGDRAVPHRPGGVPVEPDVVDPRHRAVVAAAAGAQLLPLGTPRWRAHRRPAHRAWGILLLFALREAQPAAPSSPGKVRTRERRAGRPGSVV